MCSLIKKSLLILLAAGMGFLALYFAYAFTTPSSPPPDGNIPAPLHEGLAAQTKEGNLTIQNDLTADRFCLGGACIATWSEAF